MRGSPNRKRDGRSPSFTDRPGSERVTAISKNFHERRGSAKEKEGEG